MQLLFFHPKFQLRDGQGRSQAENSAPNYARRSPWPMINLLRTSQVRAAQKDMPAGQVSRQNEEKLCAVGGTRLEVLKCAITMLLITHFLTLD